MIRTGLLQRPTRREQVEVLHVPRADLEDVRHLGHHLHVARVHDLGDDRHPDFGADFGQVAQPFDAQALERVRRGARLEGAGPQDFRAGLLDERAPCSKSISRLSTEHGPATTTTPARR